VCRSHNLMAILAAAGFLLSRFTFSATEDSLGGLARWRRGRRVQSLALAHDYPLLLSSAFATNTQETPAITACLFCSFLKPVTSPLRRSFKIFLLQNLPASKSTLTNLISVSWSRNRRKGCHVHLCLFSPSKPTQDYWVTCLLPGISARNHHEQMQCLLSAEEVRNRNDPGHH
jgi:hypothetical protein